MRTSAERPAYVLRISNPPTRREQLQIAVAIAQRAALVLVPHRCETMEEWLARYPPEQPR
ncbi:hypothetical protein [Pseudorhodoplanes sp.]|uniref:hypothetical protein n=1 Tax=Pseudorhodoplanes sp. TaxID=1934341 RepID=UPI003D0FE9BD